MRVLTIRNVVGLALAPILSASVVAAHLGGRSGTAGEPQPPNAAQTVPAAEIVALGTAQDGGLPQPGCECARCAAARRDPALRRHVASLALHLPHSGRVFLIDATPDLGEQIAVVHGFRRHPPGGADRMPCDGVLLTHAHLGHYLGLAWFGFEAIDTRELPVWASPRMAAFLAANGPWSELVRRRNIALHEIRPGEPLELGGPPTPISHPPSSPGLSRLPPLTRLTITALAVPHRDELSDTLAFVVRGPRRTLLYVPDTDSWRAWRRPLPDVLEHEKVDLAILDGTFYAASELPDRDVRQIGHPLITDTMELLGDRVRAGRLRVYFTHLNHSNPAASAATPERRALETAGFHVLEERQKLDL